MIRRRTITSYVWNSVSGNKMVILSNCIRNFFRKFELIGNSVQGEIPAPDNPQEIKSAGKWNKEKQRHEIDVKVTGKNLFDESNVKRGYITVNDTIQNATELRDEVYSDYIPVVYKNVLMTLQANIPQSEQLWSAIAFYTDDKTFIKRVAYTGLTGKSELKTKVEMMENARFIRVTYRRYGNGKMMINSGETYLPYEPYTEQSVQIALDEPLRGIGEYKDVLTKDGVVRKIKRVVLDGSEDEEWRLDRKLENHINFALVIKGAITVNTGIRTMMDKFKYLRAVWNNDLPGQDMFGAKLRINMPKTLATDLKTFKTWLSQNPLTVDYVLAEPVTEPLPESVPAQLQALHSENGITHVFVDSGEVEAGINIEYKYKS